MQHDEKIDRVCIVLFVRAHLEGKSMSTIPLSSFGTAGLNSLNNTGVDNSNGGSSSRVPLIPLTIKSLPSIGHATNTSHYKYQLLKAQQQLETMKLQLLRKIKYECQMVQQKCMSEMLDLWHRQCEQLDVMHEDSQHQLIDICHQLWNVNSHLCLLEQSGQISNESIAANDATSFSLQQQQQ
ncbi:hypothetical protein RFI_21243, partial [Reticulomyxa filosa]